MIEDVVFEQEQLLHNLVNQCTTVLPLLCHDSLSQALDNSLFHLTNVTAWPRTKIAR